MYTLQHIFLFHSKCKLHQLYYSMEICTERVLQPNEQSMNFLWRHRALKLEGILGQSVQCSHLTDEKTETRKTE